MWLYVLLVRIAALFNAKARKLAEGERKALTFLSEKIDKDCNYIWFHAASVGEFEQARPVIERLRSDLVKSGDVRTKILLTFFSPSGYELRKNYEGADIVSYLPFATRRNVRRFLDIVRPAKAVFVKYEYWPAYLHELKRRGISTYIISAIFRPSQLFFKWYGVWYRKLLDCFTTLFVQDSESDVLLGQYGIHNVVVAGDTRFDRVTQIAQQAKENQLIAAFRPDLICGSTWQPDENLLIKYFHERGSIRMLVVPHELDKSHLDRLRQELGEEAVFYTEATEHRVISSRCLVLDTIGMLSSAYRYGRAAYIGGGFGVGIHNTLEAATYSMPVVFGPNYHKFREACDLIDCGGGFSVGNYEELKNILDRLLADSKVAGEKAGKYVNSHRGATDIIYNRIFK